MQIRAFAVFADERGPMGQCSAQFRHPDEHGYVFVSNPETFRGRFGTERTGGGSTEHVFEPVFRPYEAHEARGLLGGVIHI